MVTIAGWKFPPGSFDKGTCRFWRVPNTFTPQRLIVAGQLHAGNWSLSRLTVKKIINPATRDQRACRSLDAAAIAENLLFGATCARYGGGSGIGGTWARKRPGRRWRWMRCSGLVRACPSFSAFHRALGISLEALRGAAGIHHGH